VLTLISNVVLLPYRNKTTKERSIMKTLPKHLQNLVNKLEAKDQEFRNLGGDPHWQIKAREQAEKNKDNNALIWAVIR
jgi:hypothetical protein